MRRATLPVQLVVAGRAAVVVGAAAEAAERVRELCAAGAVARAFCAQPGRALREACHEAGAVLAGRDPVEADLAGAAVVFYVDRDPATAAQLRAWAAKAGALFSASDLPEHCDFLMPAIVRRGDLTIAVGTGGASPALAARLRAALERIFDARAERFVRRLGRLRDEARTLPDAERRARLRSAVEGVEVRGELILPSDSKDDGA